MNSAHEAPFTQGGHSSLRVAVSFSSGIRAIRHIESFLDVDSVCSARRAARTHAQVVAVLVWGRKKNSAKAQAYAHLNSLPVWYLEDGFIRSCEADAHSRKTYSLMVDKSGVYYDSTQASDIETLLNLPDDQFARQADANTLAEAARCRQILVQADITKYNFCPNALEVQLDDKSGRELVLVIDQTCNDASVRCGGMTRQSFEQMLDSAIKENPEARIVVRTHPDVVVKRRKGYLLDHAREHSVEVSASADNPIMWLKRAAKVYVGTSQLGYEALLCDCRVVTFGQPFYAGWGQTDDRNPIERRVRHRSLDQLFFASHMAFTRYLDPLTAGHWSLRDCLQHIIEQKRMFARNAHTFRCVGISPWKRLYLGRYLRSPDGLVVFDHAEQSAKAGMQALTWSYRYWANPAQSDSVARVEDGFLRSRGLGSDFVAPSSLVIDRQGMYFDRHRPSDLEQLLNHHACTSAQIERAKALRQKIVSSQLSKYNVSPSHHVPGNGGADLHHGEARKSILIIGQVEDDESIARGTDKINSNSLLCEAVRARCPDDFLVFKPHPDVESGNRQGAISQQVLDQNIDELASQVSIVDALEWCDECHTMTSLTGFEALLRGKPVVTYGLPFYAGWGLTQDELVCQRRARKRSLDELVYLTLIEYPHYLHIDSGEFITPETLVDLLAASKVEASAQSTTPRWFRKADNIVKSLRYRAA